MNEPLDRLKMSIDLLKWEVTTLWQIYSAILVGNNILIIVISSVFFKDETNYAQLCILSVIGVLICFVWMASYRRNRKWYLFRLGQAKKDEKNYIKNSDNKDWYLLTGEAENYLKNSWSNKKTAHTLIIIYACIYFALLAYGIMAIYFSC